MAAAVFVNLPMRPASAKGAHAEHSAVVPPEVNHQGDRIQDLVQTEDAASMTSTSAPAPETRFYFHSGYSRVGQAAQLTTSPPSFDMNPPVGDDPAYVLDVPVIDNLTRRGIYDASWFGSVEGSIETIEVDFWQKTSQELLDEEITYEVVVYVDRPTGSERYVLKELRVPYATEAAPTRVTQTFTSMYNKAGELVPLRIDPGKDKVAIAIRDQDPIPDASVIFYDSVDYPSGFTVNVPAPPGEELATPPTTDYVEPVWFEWDKTKLDVLIAPPGHGQLLNSDGALGGQGPSELTPYDNSYIRATEDSIQAWRDAVQAFGSDRLKDGLQINSYVLGRDLVPQEALQEPEVVITTGEDNPIYLGVAISTRPCLIQNNKFFFGTSFSYADMYSINAQEFGHCLGLEHVYTGSEDRDAPDPHPVLNYDALRAYYPHQLGSNSSRLQCVSNLNVAGMELVFGEALGASGGTAARIAPDRYVRMPCNGPGEDPLPPPPSPSPSPSFSPTPDPAVCTTSGASAAGTGLQWKSVSFATPERGWVASSRDIARTDDGGETWTVKHSVRSSTFLQSSYLEGVAAVGTTGVVATASGGQFVMSADDGETWRSVKHGTYLPSPAQHATLSDVDFVDAERGWAVGTFFTGISIEGAIFSSDDGGETWERQAKLPQQWLGAVDFVDQQIGYAVGGPGYRTTDGGETWTEMNDSLPGGLNAVLAASSRVAYAADFDGQIWRSDDGGDSWKDVAGFDRDVRDLAGSEGRLFAVGDNGLAATSHDGRTWRTLDIGADVGLMSVATPTPDTAVAVGNGGRVVRMACDVSQTTGMTFGAESPTSGQYSDPAAFKVVLTADDGSQVPDAPVVFELRRDDVAVRTAQARTDDSGVAVAEFSLEVEPGVYSVVATYGGGASYEGSSATSTLTVDREDSALALSVNGVGASRTVNATLTDGDAAQNRIGGRQIGFFADGVLIGCAQTDAAGVAQLQVPPRYRGAQTEFGAVFAGDLFFYGSVAGLVGGEVCPPP